MGERPRRWRNDLRFATRSGELQATRRPSGDATHDATPTIELDFPAEIARASPPPPELLFALRLPTGRPPNFIGRNRTDWLVELPDPDGDAILRALAPDLAALARIEARGVIVTAQATGATPPDFVARFFAPAAGVPEDPVTGSAHCALAPNWCERLGRQELIGYQASPRGGTVGVALRGDRVLLRGHAITVVKGEILAQE